MKLHVVSLNGAFVAQTVEQHSDSGSATRAIPAPAAVSWHSVAPGLGVFISRQFKDGP